jgi:hypothetical protein
MIRDILSYFLSVHGLSLLDTVGTIVLLCLARQRGLLHDAQAKKLNEACQTLLLLEQISQENKVNRDMLKQIYAALLANIPGHQ